MTERPEEPRLTASEALAEPDQRLTQREWVLYWKLKFEDMLRRFNDLAQYAGKQKQMLKDQARTIAAVNEKVAQLERQLHDLQAARQKAAEAEGGAPEPKVKRFKKGK